MDTQLPEPEQTSTPTPNERLWTAEHVGCEVVHPLWPLAGNARNPSVFYTIFRISEGYRAEATEPNFLGGALRVRPLLSDARIKQ